MGVYRGGNLLKKTRKQELDQESDQENTKKRKKTRTRPRKRTRKKEKNFPLFLDHFLGRVLVFFLFFFFYKFPPQYRGIGYEFPSYPMSIYSRFKSCFICVFSYFSLFAVHWSIISEHPTYTLVYHRGISPTRHPILLTLVATANKKKHKKTAYSRKWVLPPDFDILSLGFKCSNMLLIVLMSSFE